jgi:hypothetical protein
MATSGKQLSSLPNVSNFGGTNEMLTWVGDGLAQKVTRDEFMASLPENRQAATAYTVGTIKYHPNLPTGWYLECTTAGTTGSGALTISSPAIGGTVTDGTVTWRIAKAVTVFGGVIYDRILAKRNVTDGILTIMGGDDYPDGAYLNLFGKEASSPSFFQLTARNGSNYISLMGGPTGQLTWGDNDLAGSAIVAKSLSNAGYIKYASGLIVQWGFDNVVTSTFKQITFPISFTNACSVFVSSVNPNASAGCIDTQVTGFKIYTNSTSSNACVWLAIGT